MLTCRSDRPSHGCHRRAITTFMYVGIFVTYLPLKAILGLTAGEDWLFKASLLGTVSKLIGVGLPCLTTMNAPLISIPVSQSTKEHSTPLCALVVPLIRDSFTSTVSYMWHCPNHPPIRCLGQSTTR